MPQLSNLTLNGGGADHEFKARDIVGGVATLVESNGVPIADRRLTISLNRTTQGRVKGVLKFVLPEVQDVVVNGVSRPTVVRTAYADITLTFDQTSNLAERGELIDMIKSFFGSTMCGDVFYDLESLY